MKVGYLREIRDEDNVKIAEWYKTDMQGHFVVNFMTTEPHICVAILRTILKELGAE